MVDEKILRRILKILYTLFSLLNNRPIIRYSKGIMYEYGKQN